MKEKRAASNVVRLALVVIGAHALVLSLHAAAHQILGVQASTVQTLFIVTVIIIAPLLAGILLWKRVVKAGAALLACSMIGSFIFGIYNHFLASSPDHVSQVSRLSPTAWAIVFQVTAYLLAALEAVGLWAGMLTLKKGLTR